MPLSQIFCCAEHPVPQSHINSTLLANFLTALQNLKLKGALTRNQDKKELVDSSQLQLFPPNRSNDKLPRSIIHVESITPGIKRWFLDHYYLQVPGKNFFKTQMYPEESFVEVEFARVEEELHRIEN